MYCRQCGKELNEDETYCSICGTRRGRTGQPPVKQEIAKQPRHRNKRKWIGVGVAVLVVIGVIASISMFTPLGNTASKSLDIILPSEPEYKVSKRAYVYRNGLRTEEEFSYDGEGRLMETHRLTDYKDESGEVQTEDYRESITYISDSDYLYEKTVANAEDSNENGSFRKVVHDTLNEKGDFVTRTIEGYDGAAETINATYEYYHNGKVSKCIDEYTYSEEGSSDWRWKQYETTYDENGKVTYSRVEYEDGDVSVDTYARSPDGTLITREHEYSSSSYSTTTVFYYDEYENEASVKYDDGTVCQYELSLDSDGRVLRRVEPQISIEDGITRDKSIYEYQYDNNGNESYMSYESYAFDSDVPNEWSYEVYTEYIKV